MLFGRDIRLELYPRETIVSDGDETVRLQELGIVDVPAMANLINYSPEHVRGFFTALPSGDYVGLDALYNNVASTNPGRHRFGIWHEGTMRGVIEMMGTAEGGEIGYWVGKEHIGHAYAARATRLLTRYVLSRPEVTGISVVYTKIAPDNIASIRTSQNAGFQESGQLGDWLIFTRTLEDELAVDA